MKKSPTRNNRAHKKDDQLSEKPVNPKIFVAIISICISIAVAILLIPYVTNELWWDDSLTSQIWANVHRFNIVLPEYTWLKIKHSIASGRLLLCFIYLDVLFYFFHTTFAIRLTDMLMVLINVVLFAWVLHKLKIRSYFIAIFILILFGLFRITPYYDPLAALAWLYPSLGIMFCISLLLLVKWQETRLVKFLWLSGAVSFFSVCCYEIGLFYFPIAVYFVYTNQNDIRLKIKNLLVAIAPCLLYFTIIFLIRLNHSTLYGGIEVGDITNVPITYLKQLLAPLPGAYYLIIMSQQMNIGYLLDFIVNSPVSWLLLSVCFIASIILLNIGKLRGSNVNAGVYKLGFALFLLPSLLISFSARYQHELVWGLGYLPIYYQYFGLALLLTGFLMWITKTNKFIALFCSIMIALVITFNWALNVQIANGINARWWSQPSLKAQVAMQPDFFAALQDGDVVEIDSISDSINGALIYMLSGKRVNVPEERGLDFNDAPFSQPRFQQYLQPSFKPSYFKLHTVDNPAYQHYWELTPEPR